MRRVRQAPGDPAAHLNRRHAPSPIATLIDIKIGCGLCRFIPVGCPVRLDWHLLTHPRITVLPQQRPTCRGDVWWFYSIAVTAALSGEIGASTPN